VKSELPIEESNKRPRVYLAGPEVFLPNAIEIGERKKTLCKDYGFEGVFPTDAILDVKNKSRRSGLCISATNESLIKSCKLIIANLTPFRGPSADVGTAYELGFGHGIGLTVFAYTNVAALFTERTVSWLNNSVTRNKDGKLRDTNEMVVEEWGLIDNLMLDGCISKSGGVFVIENARKDEVYTDLSGFRKCLMHAKTAFFLT
jgi:nucleoside 2-deoxyribosyltransferase